MGYNHMNVLKKLQAYKFSLYKGAFNNYTDRNNLVKLVIQVTQFLDLLFERTLMLVLSTLESGIDVG